MGSGKDYRKDPKFRAFVKWKALPEWRRREEDMVVYESDWAEKFDIAPTTLWRWKQTDAYEEMMEEIVETWLEDSIPGVVKTAEAVATEKDAKGHNDRKLLLELYGMVGHKTIRHEGTIEHEHSIGNPRTMTESQLREGMRAELRKKPRFADATDEELDMLIDAFADANTGGEMPDSTQEPEKSMEYLLEEPPDEFKQDTD